MTLHCSALALTFAIAAAGLSSSVWADLPAPLADADYLHDGAPNQALVDLGQSLFFDPILSGNRNIACGTCHDPRLGTGDGLALGLGEGANGLGAARRTEDPVVGHVPRNAQPLYNVGARAYTAFLHDGRVEVDPDAPSGFRSPARDRLPDGLTSALAAQALFPMISSVEMAGQRGENPVADAVADFAWEEAWHELAGRLSATPEYRAAFAAAFEDIPNGAPVTIVHAANALAAFQSVAFRSDQSPFDLALQTGDAGHLPAEAIRGFELFYGDAGCSRCHAGALLTDHQFHAIAMPQIGPGKAHGEDLSYWEAANFRRRLEDEGRFDVTGDPEDLFAFRTPSLRNVALTGPWGHAGSFATLEAVIRHHADPVTSLEAYQLDPATLPELDRVIEPRGRNNTLRFVPVSDARRPGYDLRADFVQTSDALRGRIAAANDLAPTELSDDDVSDLVAFLHALTDPTAVDRSHLIPATVLSGLPVTPARPGQVAAKPSAPNADFTSN